MSVYLTREKNQVILEYFCIKIPHLTNKLCFLPGRKPFHITKSLWQGLPRRRSGHVQRTTQLHPDWRRIPITHETQPRLRSTVPRCLCLSLCKRFYCRGVTVTFGVVLHSKIIRMVPFLLLVCPSLFHIIFRYNTNFIISFSKFIS